MGQKIFNSPHTPPQTCRPCRRPSRSRYHLLIFLPQKFFQKNFVPFHIPSFSYRLIHFSEARETAVIRSSIAIVHDTLVLLLSSSKCQQVRVLRLCHVFSWDCIEKFSSFIYLFKSKLLVPLAFKHGCIKTPESTFIRLWNKKCTGFKMKKIDQPDIQQHPKDEHARR